MFASTRNSLHPVDQHLEVQLAHAGDDRLTGLVVGVHPEGRVFLREPLDGGSQLLLVGLGPRLDRLFDDRRRKVHRLQNDLSVRVAQGLGGGVLEPHHGDDLAAPTRAISCRLLACIW